MPVHSIQAVQPLEAHRARHAFVPPARPERRPARPHATLLGCLGGGAAREASGYLRDRHGIVRLDPLRLPSPLALLAGRGDPRVASWARSLVRRSALQRRSGLIAVVGHADCRRDAGAPDEQIEDLCESVERIGRWDLGVEAVGLWIDETGALERLV